MSIRALGLGEKTPSFDNDGEISIDVEKGTVNGLRIDCTDAQTTNKQATPPITGQIPGADFKDFTVGQPRYNEAMTSVDFTVDTERSALFVLPFGYFRGLRVMENMKSTKLYRTNEWMSVVVVPAGHSQITITEYTGANLIIRIVDFLFVASLFGAFVVSLRPCIPPFHAKSESLGEGFVLV